MHSSFSLNGYDLQDLKFLIDFDNFSYDVQINSFSCVCSHNDLRLYILRGQERESYVVDNYLNHSLFYCLTINTRYVSDGL